MLCKRCFGPQASVIHLSIHLVSMAVSAIKFCTATESVAALEAVCNELSKMQLQMNQMIPTAQINGKLSTMTEAMRPLLEFVAEITPQKEHVARKQALPNHARHAFGTDILNYEMNGLITGTGSADSTYLFVVG